jgi:hypothetical protein
VNNADFVFSFDGLSLELTDISNLSGIRLWEVSSGGVSVATSDLKTFLITLDDGALYSISLKVTVGTTIYTSSVEILAEAEELFLYQTITQIVLSLLPSGTPISEVQLQQGKYKWQAILAKGLKIPEQYTHNELKWPYLANLLIGYLLVRDLIIQSINQLLLATGSGGEVKKIVTGPAEVEYHGSDSSLTKLLGKDGALDLFQNQICAIAARLGIHISGCEYVTVIPLQVMYNSDRSYEHKYPRAPELLPKIK